MIIDKSLLQENERLLELIQLVYKNLNNKWILMVSSKANVNTVK